VLIAAYPTRGVDIRAAQAIRRLLLDLRARGRGVVLISEDLGEITDLCDRVIVLFEGRIVGACPVEQVEPRLLGRLMMGQENALREAVGGAP
jgi:general nucleoside transport system ATP-binding protein